MGINIYLNKIKEEKSPKMDILYGCGEGSGHFPSIPLSRL